MNKMSGAGIQTAMIITEQGVDAVITGNIGPNAFQTLSAAGIETFTGVSGKVSDAIEQLKKNELEPNPFPSVDSHYGLTDYQAKSKKSDSKMRILISAEDDRGLDAQTSTHFGRCPYYTIVDLEGNDISSSGTVENPYYNHHKPGQVPNFIKDQNANVIISGGMGQRAIQLFNDFEIEPITGASGNVRDALAEYLDGRLSGTSPCSGDHG
jgi:predicted Fe-Mo cluster-binding NifX family protein